VDKGQTNTKIRAADGKFILKDVGRSGVEEVRALVSGLERCPFIRTPFDTILEPGMVVYRYFSDELLSLVQESLPLEVTKRILRDTLLGLAALHEQNIVHTGKTGHLVSVAHSKLNAQTSSQTTSLSIEQVISNRK